VAWSWEGAIPEDAQKSVSMDGVRLATLVPVAPTFAPAPCEVVAGRAYVLSRFAYMRVEGGEMRLESPLAQARIVPHDWRTTAIVHLLAGPRRVEDLRAQMPSVSEEATRALVALFVAARMASEATEAGGCATDTPVALRSWEFHDLLFHARSRGGRHDQPVGGTYRFLAELEPPPVLVSTSSERPVELYRPDLRRLEETDPPFARVQEARRSIRVYGARPLTARQLGEFLYRIGRVADYWEDELPTPRGPVRLASAARPYPAGGGLYELELYVLVNRCDGLDAGLYRHDPERHCLHPLAAAPDDLDALLTDASLSTMIPREQLQIMIVVAARFQRIAWKYAAIAYSVVLKDVGVLYQTMYLVATAMGLAPCGLGCGNADLFARAAGIDYYAETSVGEFLLGSQTETEG
jgi:SagB-type dehydrogenase family enzyme